jgi:hypothetical protein
MKGWLKMLFPWLQGNTNYDSDCVRREIRDKVHAHRNIAAVALSESRRAERVSDRSLRVAEDAIQRLEQSRREESDDAA